MHAYTQNLRNVFCCFKMRIRNFMSFIYLVSKIHTNCPADSYLIFSDKSFNFNIAPLDC